MQFASIIVSHIRQKSKRANYLPVDNKRRPQSQEHLSAGGSMILFTPHKSSQMGAARLSRSYMCFIMLLRHLQALRTSGQVREVVA